MSVGFIEWSPIQRKEIFFKELCNTFNIETGAIETLFSCLGNGDRVYGLKVSSDYLTCGMISIEKIGFDKRGASKFFIVMKLNQIRGGWNQFSVGISRRGAFRAVLRPLSPAHKDSENLANARELTRLLGKKYQGSISRLMNDENGVKVVELGGENLFDLSLNAALSQVDRKVIYKSLFEGICELHRLGFVHTDLKLQNVVVMRDEEDRITGVKIIDLDRLLKQGESHGNDLGMRYLPYSPERMLGSDRGLADAKDDLWAAMMMILELESRSYGETMLLNLFFISQFEKYKEDLLRARDLRSLFLEKSLFSGANPHSIMEHVIFNMAKIEPEKRPSGEQLLPFFKGMV